MRAAATRLPPVLTAAANSLAMLRQQQKQARDSSAAHEGLNAKICWKEKTKKCNNKESSDSFAVAW